MAAADGRGPTPYAGIKLKELRRSQDRSAVNPLCGRETDEKLGIRWLSRRLLDGIVHNSVWTHDYFPELRPVSLWDDSA